MRSFSLFGAALAAMQVWTAAGVSAQTLVLRLVDEASADPVVGASVSLLTGTGESVSSGISDPRGRVVLTPPAAGEYVIEVARIGYRAYRSPLLAMVEEGTRSLDLPMRPEPIGLGGLEVVGEGNSEALLESLGLSVAELGNRWIERAEIDAMNLPGLPKDVIRRQNLPGIWVQESRSRLCVTIRGGGCALTVLDGVVISHQLAFILDPSSLEAIAILRPREALILFGTQGGNGAVLFWTRQGRAR